MRVPVKCEICSSLIHTEWLENPGAWKTDCALCHYTVVKTPFYRFDMPQMKIVRWSNEV